MKKRKFMTLRMRQTAHRAIQKRLLKMMQRRRVTAQKVFPPMTQPQKMA